MTENAPRPVVVRSFFGSIRDCEVCGQYAICSRDPDSERPNEFRCADCGGGEVQMGAMREGRP